MSTIIENQSGLTHKLKMGNAQKSNPYHEGKGVKVSKNANHQ